MLELTLLLVVAAAALFVLLRARRKANVEHAADAARKAVEGRMRRDTNDR